MGEEKLAQELLKIILKSRLSEVNIGLFNSTDLDKFYKSNAEMAKNQAKKLIKYYQRDNS